MTQEVDPDHWTRMSQFVKGMHRDVYPAIDPKNPKNSAAGKKVLITGGNRGIGKGISTAWAKAGAASIIITGRDKTELKAVEAEIKKISPQTDVLATSCDIADSDAVAELFAKIKSHFGVLDVLVLNAGILTGGDGWPKIGDMDPKLWWRDFDVNLKGTFNAVHYFVKSFGGETPKGTVIGLATGPGLLASTMPGTSAYTISKAGVVRLIEFLDAEYPEMHAFSLNPGIVKTQSTLAAFEPFAIDTPGLVGAFTVYLSTSNASYLSGRYLTPNWDVDEMEEHKEEIVEKGLLKTTFLNAKLSAEGHPFEK